MCPTYGAPFGSPSGENPYTRGASLTAPDTRSQPHCTPMTGIPAAPNGASRSCVEARALRWRRGTRWIVDGVSLTLRSGEIVGLLGPNGAGKTVTLTTIAGLLTPTSGSILIDGDDVTALPLYKRARRGLSYLPQERSVFRRLSAVDNVALVLETHGVPKAAARRRAHELLGEFGLEHVASRLALQLSGGEQRRLEVARSLAIEPRFLLFDEPFAGVDPLTIETLHTMLVDLRRRGVGILITDHNVHETMALCDRAYVLHNGRVLEEGTPSQLVSNQVVRQAFLGDEFQLA
jgi:lipopolysaccharide export system ATP-binding protein